MNEKIWNADGTWNIIKNDTHTICHRPMWPISSDMQSPVSSRLCGSLCCRVCAHLSVPIWVFERFDRDVALPITHELFNDFSSHLCVKFVTHALFLLFTKFSRKLNTFCQMLFFVDSLSDSLFDSDDVISIFELFTFSGISIVPDAANSTFCRKFSPLATKPSLFRCSEVISKNVYNSVRNKNKTKQNFNIKTMETISFQLFCTNIWVILSKKKKLLLKFFSF